jgi:putative photosynthetic complex assembly protein
MSERTGNDSGDRNFPRGVLYGALALFTIAVIGAAGSRLTGIGTTEMPETAAVVDVQEFVVEDRDGSVVIRDAADETLIAVLPPGTNGFIRSVLRGFARDRRMHGVGEEPPFVLTRWSDGRLTLDDPTTGREVYLEAFGPTNAQAFARLMTASAEDAGPPL